MTDDAATRSSDTAAAAGPVSERLSLRLIVEKALATARERFWVVMLPAVVLFVPLTLLETYVEHFADEQTSDSSATGLLVTVLSLAGTSGLLFGWVLYTGLLDTIVGAHHFGRPEEPLRRRLRTLPYLTLIGASIVLDMLVVIGSGLLVVPGLLALTVFGIVGPVIVIERRGVVSAFIRSARLSLPHIGIAFGAIALPFLLEQAIEDLMLLVWPHSLWESALVAIGLTLCVGVSVSLIEVVFANELIARDPPRRGGGD
jgi:hypothetical protein